MMTQILLTPFTQNVSVKNFTAFATDGVVYVLIVYR